MIQFCKAVIAGCLLLMTVSLQAQTIVHIGAGGQMYIGTKTAVSLDSLVMLPSQQGFVIKENDISKLATPNNAFPGAYVSRVYCFSHPLIHYSGSFGIFYNDKEAGDINVNKLLMQAYTGFAWYPLKEDKARNARRNVVGGLGVYELSFNELLLGYETGDAASRKAPIALAPLEEAQNSVSIFPNPAATVVTVRVNAAAVIQSVKVFDASGKLIMVKQGSNSNVYSFTVSSLASGAYRMAIETNTGKVSKGFIKQ